VGRAPRAVWQTEYHLETFRSLVCEEVWEQVFRALGEEELEQELVEVHLDSSIIKAQQTVSTGRRHPAEKSDADERRCLGRIRSGLTTKIHAVTGECGKLVHFLLTPGQKFKPGKAGGIVADTAYGSDSIRQHGRRLKAKVCIKPNPGRKIRKQYDRKISQFVFSL